MSRFARSGMRCLGAGVGLLCTVATGCAASVSLRVPSTAIANLPLERRLTLLDAESDVLAAQDARQAQDDRLAAAVSSVEEARQRVRDAENALRKQEDARAPADVAQVAITEASARERAAEADEALERARLSTADATLLLAQAKFELARARELDAAGQAARYGVRVADYQAQVDRVTAFVQERSDDEAKSKAAADEASAGWKDASKQLVQLTGGAQGSVWVQ